MPQWGGGQRCRRCDKSVYSNKQIISAGGLWHKRTCFTTCKDCGKYLDSNTVTEKEAETYAPPALGAVCHKL